MANPIKYSTATNLLKYSQDFTNANWGKVNVTATASTTTAPDGSNSASTLTATAGYTQLVQYNVVPIGYLTISYYVKYINQQYMTIVHQGTPYFTSTFDLINGTKGGVGGTTGFAISNSMTSEANGFYRISVTFGVTQSNFNLGAVLWFGYYNGNDNSGSQVYVWGAQLQLGSVATPYITTTASSVTTGLTQSNSIKAGNFAVGVNKGGYGPTNITNFYNGKTPNVGGYTVYVSNGTASPSPLVVSNDTELIILANKFGAATGTPYNALNFFNTSSTMLCTNMDYPNIVTSGLVLNLDAAYTPSYPKGLTTWTDLSGNGNNGTLVNGPSYSSTDGGSIGFDGSNDYVSAPSLANTAFPQDTGTIAIWYNIDSTGQTASLPPIFDGFDGTRNHIFIRRYNNPIYTIQIGFNYIPLNGLSYVYVSNHLFTLDAWHNIVVTYTAGISSSVKVYIDGGLVNSGTISDSAWRPTGQFVGFGSPTQQETTKGKGGAIQVYNRVLSATEILQNYYAGLQRFIPTNGLVLSLDGDNTDKQVTTASIAYDMSGNKNNGTLNNGTALVSNGQRSFSFDGTNDTITLTATPSSLGMIGGSFSVNIWMYNNGTTKGGLVSSNSNAIPGGQYEFSINSANNIQVTYYGGGSVNTAIVSNTWYMLTHTYNYTTKSSKLYKNGSLASSVTMTVDLSVTSTIYIGWYGFGGGYFNGYIGQPRIYNRELTSTEILTMYSATRSRYGV